MKRREFIRSATLGGIGLLILRDPKSAWSYQANNKLNMAFVGAGGQGGGLVGTFSGLGENIAALCDVDDQRAADTYKRFPNAKKFKDFRKMLDEMANEIDVVVVSTPDHTHAAPSVAAMKLGKHVYCEKPLTWCIGEARVMRQVALEKKVVTQMGNQGTGDNRLRQAVQVVWSGVIGKVREVHIWSNRPIWPQGMDRPKETPPVPPHLDWDLWLGPAPYRPYHPDYLPFRWRGWCDFGTGALGDMGCHTMNMPVMALKLHETIAEGKTIVVEAEHSGCNGESYPNWSIVRYYFPERGDLPSVTFTWYDGGKKPPADVLPEGLSPEKLPGSGALLIGDKGILYSPGDYASDWRLLPAEQFKDFQPPELTMLPRSPGHHREFVLACKGENIKPLSNFVDYAVYLTEIVLLGNLAIRLGQKVVWDAKRGRVIGNPDAEPLVMRPYREGWKL
ncbi:MAG: Gfo/Idh/MocA family oxidoreductase [Armatimonadota bacterium]|nr:Gfo/Idh/MocA family oxidoreductase [Armatimonadota bacterium]MDW8143905.1 Gfo/Idh/MocA family oxidoreductase [Armatimonadota bacterium]